jgi:hypothetical protein
VAFATLALRSGTTAFTGASSLERLTTPTMIIRIIIPTAAAAPSGPITDPGVSVIITTGATITGVTTTAIITTAFIRA